MLFIITARAEVSGANAYNKAVAKQLQRETGVSAAAARKAINANAKGRQPFTPAPGKNASGANVRRNTAKIASRS